MANPPPQRDPHTGCLLWQGSFSSSGYPTDWSSGKPRQAHIVAWEAVNGPFPPGKQCDHACRRIACLFEPHLDPVSVGENQRRKSWAYRSRIKACKRGHDLFLLGRRTPEGGIVCLRCSGVVRGRPEAT